MTTVQQILTSKGNSIWSITPEASVFDAIKLMAEKEIGALIVLQSGKPVGVISERDYARKVILEGRSAHATQVCEIMTSHVIFAHPTQSIESCMALMTEKRIRHLPVLEDGCLLGMISIGDLVKTIIAEQRFVIDQLEHYITG